MTHPAIALREVVERLRTEHAARYAVLVDTTLWSFTGGEVTVEGAVLVPAQADDYQRALAAALDPERPPREFPRPVVLSELGAPFALQRWAPLQGPGPLDVFRGPTGEELQTQWTERAVLRVFLREPDAARVLVQTPDGTVGWVARGRVGGSGTQPSGDPWGRYRRADLGGPVPPARGGLSEVARAARARIGRPYRWGGNTPEAADCSGFVQSVLYEGSGILLPKNTRDQMIKGSRVGVTAIGPGDLVFVRGLDAGILHVGLALPASRDGGEEGDLPGAGVHVIHSCLSRNVVLEEALDSFLHRYRFTAARRVIAWAGAERP